MPTSPPYSYVTFTVTSGMVATPEFSYASISLLPDGLVSRTTQLQVYLNGVLLTYSTQYTLIANYKIEISSTLAVGDIVTIVRNTEKGTRYVDFSDNNLLTQEDMDNSALQQFFISQQAYDKAYASITLDVSKSWWQGNNKQLKNIGPATESSSAITKSQMEAYVTGGVIAEIDDYRIYSYDGGLNTDFALASNLYGITAKQVIVTINGELQQTSENASGTNNSPGAASGYTLVNVGGVPTVRFADPVNTGASVSIRVIKGTYATTPQSGGILTDAIADDSVTLAKLSFVDGVADRYLKVNTTGDASLAVLSTASIPDFDTEVLAKTLDQFAVPVAAVQFGGQQITGIADGTAATHAVSKSQMDTAIAAISNVSIYTGAISALLYAASPAYRTYTNPDGYGFDVLQIDWYSTTGATYPASSAGRVAAIYGTDTFPMAVTLTGSSGAITCYITRTATGFTVYRSTATGGNVSMRFKYTVLS